MSTHPSAAPASVHGICRLTDWGVMRATGADAASFLHGQLTQDMQHIATGSARLAGYCSAKGRLLASLLVWHDKADPGAADSLLLACSADVLQATLKRLSMFVLRAKCKLSDASAEWPLYGVAGSDAARALGVPGGLPVWGQATVGAGAAKAHAIRLPDAVVSGTATQRHLWASAVAPQVNDLTEDTWRWLEVHSGVARITAATSEQFVPQMVNFELVGGVNFQKGCYPGQEIVARSQYRGTLKRRAQVLLGSEAMLPGQEIFNSADPEQPAGMVALAGHRLAGDELAYAALAELKLAALESGSLHLGSAGGPVLHVSALPYAIPATQD